MIRKKEIVVILFLFVFTLLKVLNCHPDAVLNTIQLIRKHGYPIERHGDLMTKDGYLLEMHRIPYGKKKRSGENVLKMKERPAILVMHGILSSSADWVNMGPEKGLAYILADEGYDVWLGNARGNTWSRKHIKLNPERNNTFWNFSWHEIGLYDLPCMIDHVIKKTKQEKIFYAAHSQGTTAFFVMTSLLPQYNDKIRLGLMMAPIAYMKYVKNIFIQEIAKFTNSLEWISKTLGLNEFLPHTSFLSAFASVYCKENDVFQPLCTNALFLIGGYSTQLNKTMIPVILRNTPAGSSTKQLVHFGQLVKSGRFAQFDYGKMMNGKLYGSKVSPNYDFGKITAPLALYYGASDMLTDFRDLRKLYESLPNVVYNMRISDESFGHLDFMWGMNAPHVLYTKMLAIMKRF